MEPPATPSTRLRDLDGPGSLIVGVGNLGRQDDGLGWAFVDAVEAGGLCPGAALVRRYQLQLEDADLFAWYDRVLVVDASREESLTGHRLSSPVPRLDVTFTSHAMSVPCVLATTATCFGRIPAVVLLAIRGYSWDLSVGLTQRAVDNLSAALSDLTAEGRSPSITDPCRTPA
ncbi:MAG: hydrogenase maturation protease [Kineosporiaceae bacterium]|nr:hydrogenase maturation protease [Kineosporiaceae bacterium]